MRNDLREVAYLYHTLFCQPWLDFLPASEAIEAAKLANEDLEEWCKPSKSELDSTGNPSGVFSAGDARSSFTPALPPQSRIRAFGILPFSQDVPTSELVSSLEGIAKSNVLKGAIIGTRGRGKGLDDPELEALWESAEKHDQPLFLHPHYGVGSDSVNEDGLFGGKSNGHVLPLALGFPFETASVSECHRPEVALHLTPPSLSGRCSINTSRCL